MLKGFGHTGGFPVDTFDRDYAPQSFSKVRSDAEIRIGHPHSDQLYEYVLGRRFDPGAQAETFEPLFELPILSFRGRARLAGQYKTLQHPQVYVHQRIPGAGIPTIAGQLISAPLDIPEGEQGT